MALSFPDVARKLGFEVSLGMEAEAKGRRTALGSSGRTRPASTVVRNYV